MFVGHVPDALENTASDSIAKIFSGRLGVNIAEIDRPVETGPTGRRHAG